MQGIRNNASMEGLSRNLLNGTVPSTWATKVLEIAA